jgi:hypothetical protein
MKMDGLVIMHEKHASGRSANMSDVSGRIKADGKKYNLYCSFSKQLTAIYTDKQKGFLLANDGKSLFLVFVKNGYRLNSSGANTVRGSFTSVIYETPINKDLLSKYGNRSFVGEVIDPDTIQLLFEEE